MNNTHRRRKGLILLVVGIQLLPLLASAAGGGIQNPISCNDLVQCLANVIKAALGLVGVLAVGFVVYGGFLYITSQGDESQMKQGKQAITGAVIGIIVIGLAYAIVQFVSQGLGAGGGGGGGGGYNQVVPR